MAQHKDRDKRPKGCPIDYETIPDELRPLKQWILWRYDWNVKSGSWAKVPYQPTGERAASDNPDTWSQFDTVMVTMEQSKSSYDGIGFMFANGYVGVDVDNCVTDDGEHHLSLFATRVMEKLNTYTELSPSLTGIHCIGKADQFTGFNRVYQGNKIEGYSKGRYFTFTGRSWDETPREVRNIQDDLSVIIKAVTKTEDDEPKPLTIQQRIDMALKDPKTHSLYWGNTSEYGGDDSAADMALCAKFAYYSGGDRDTLDAMFRTSSLMRTKWDEKRGHDTYGNITMDKVLSGQTRFLGSKPAKVEKVTNYDGRKLRRFTMADLKDKALEYYSSGASRGVHPGWDELEPLYRPAPSMLSIVTGEPGSGKSNWVDCLVANLAKRHQWVTTFASFETLPIERHVLTLAQIHIGFPTFAWAENAASVDELEEAIDALNPYFHFIMPDDHELNIESVLEYVDDDLRDYGINGFVLDPFTELEQTRSGNLSQTEMIEKILRLLQRFTRQRKIHTWLIAHPTKSGETYKDGRPTLRSISGSANFYNKADFGIIVDRQEDDRTVIHVDKVRFDANGARGKVEFMYSPTRRKYYGVE